MKKLFMVLLAVGLVFALTLPAAAFDSEFGGYFRTRAYTQKDFSGYDSGSQDLTRTDMRTRLFYTAVFSEDFKFVNKFEFNSIFGDVNTGGEISSSTANRNIFRIKNSYAYFNLGAFNFMAGIQPRILNRGFLVDTDFAGLAVTYMAPGINFPFIWMKAYEGGQGDDYNDFDVDYYALKPTFTFGNGSVTPTLTYMYSKDASKWSITPGNKEVKVWFAGLDADVKFGGGSVWFTGIYEGGTFEKIRSGYTTLTDSVDVQAYLLALGGKVDLGSADIHAQVFYATGDDTATADKFEKFAVPRGQMYYWSEIMGYGIFDNQASANSCKDQIGNIMAANIGVGVKATDSLNIKADLWHAKLAESNAAGDDVLGTEIDLVLTYSLMKNLNLDLVGAYLFAGDATYSGANDANPYEIGARLSFSF